MQQTENKLYLFLIGFIVIVSSVALFGDIMEPDGALYASIAKNIVLRNDWVNLYAHNLDWLDKPHLPFWISAAFFKIFGVSAFAYKLPSFLIGLLGTWYLYRFAKEIYDEKTALISVIVFLTALHVLISNLDVRAEGYLTAFIMASVYHYYKAHRSSFWHIIAGSFFLACAVMVKGIFVLIPVFTGFIIYWLVNKQYRELMKPKWWAAILFIFIFITPELYALYIQFDLHPEKVVFGRTGVSGLKFFFWDSQFGRFFNNGPIQGKGDISFFLHTNLWAFLPWSVFFYTAVVTFLKKKNRTGMPVEGVIIWASAGSTFLLFSLSKFQLPHYIIIIFPQFAIITALYLIRLQGKALKIFFIVQNVIFIIVIVLLVTIGILFGFQSNYLSGGMLLVILIAAFTLFKGLKIQTIIARCAMLSVGIMIFLYLFFYPAILKYQSGMMAGKWLKKNYPAADSKAVMSDYSFSFDFYTNGEVKYLYNDTDIEKAGSEKDVVIYTSETELAKLKNEYKVEVLKSFDYYHITKLKGTFINYRTRPSVLDRFYLIKLH